LIRKDIRLRKAEAPDETFIREMLYQAVYVEPGAPRPDASIVYQPELKKYWEQWGRESDLGYIAEEESGRPVGAVWLRLFTAEDPGYGFAGEGIPELSIALLPESRGRGTGTALLRTLLKDADSIYPVLSLSVDPSNGARHLYERMGFGLYGTHGTSDIMIRRRLTFDTLENIPLAVLADTFTRAFSDYEVVVHMTVEKLSMMMRERDVDPAGSLGAFEEDRLVGFILNGYRRRQGESLAYNSGTGILPDYRGRGLGRLLMERNTELLGRRGAGRYILEVLTGNTPAIRLYETSGFRTLREFACLRCRTGHLRTLFQEETGRGRVELFSVKDTPFEELQFLVSSAPSWQNDAEAMKNPPDCYRTAVFRTGGKTLAYGILNTGTGSLLQFGLQPAEEGAAAARQVLAVLAEMTDGEYITAVNVETSANRLLDFLDRTGFESFISQYEMTADL